MVRAKRAPVPKGLDMAPDTAEPPIDADDDLETEADGVAAATDNVGEQSVEINVEGLIAELEAETRQVGKRNIISARRKLEDYLERKRVAHDLEDFEDFEVND
jgi:hypothetical protein